MKSPEEVSKISHNSSSRNIIKEIIGNKALLIFLIFLLLILPIIIIITILLVGSNKSEPQTVSEEEEDTQTGSTEDTIEPVAAPNVKDKIKGYWSSRGGSMILGELDDAERMKEDGINTVTFSPQLSHSQEGKVTESSGAESQTKRAINKAHEAGFRVMLETTPMNAGSVDPKVTDVELFQSEMSKVAVKYATIAEEFNVEYFGPIVEPVHHMSVEEADEWLQELLPELKEVYSGPVMWKKQAMHLIYPKEWKQDHIMTLGFKLDSNELIIRLKSGINQQITFLLDAHHMSMSEWEGNMQKFMIKQYLNLNLLDYHTLQFRLEGKQIKVFLNGALMLEHTDDSGPKGGYAISSEGMRINLFEVTNIKGKSLLTEKFKHLNNWSAQEGWAIDGDEIVVTSSVDSKLLHDIDFSGYDYLAIDTFKRGQVQTNEEYIEQLEFIIDKTNQQAESDGVEHVIIAEFGGSVMEEIGWIDVDERAKIPMTETELAEVTQMVLELAEDTVDGYIYNGWDIEGQGIKRMPEVEAVIKDWYTSP